MTTPAVQYVTPEQLRKALNLRDVTDPRLDRVCTAVSDSIDWQTGHWDYATGSPVRMDPAPAIVAEVALAFGVDLWKQPDAGFGIVGLAETGPVRIPRELAKRFQEQLAPVMVSWGIA